MMFTVDSKYSHLYTGISTYLQKEYMHSASLWIEGRRTWMYRFAWFRAVQPGSFQHGAKVDCLERHHWILQNRAVQSGGQGASVGETTWRQKVSKVYSKLRNSSEVGLSYPHKIDLVWIWSFYHFLWFWHWHSLQESGFTWFLSSLSGHGGWAPILESKAAGMALWWTWIYARCIRLKDVES